MSTTQNAGELSLINSFTHKWTIDNSTSYCEKPYLRVNLNSPKFVINPNIKINFRLQIHNEDIIASRKGSLTIFPQLIITSGNAVTVDYEFYMLNSENEIVLSQCHDHFYYTFPIKPEYGAGLWLINKSTVTNPEHKLLTDDKFTILCKINIINDKINEPFLSFKNCSEAEKLCHEENFKDTTLIVNGEELKVHKAILSTKSPVFYAMFCNNLREANKNLVTINDFSFDVLEDVVQFMYTGNIENFEYHVNELMAAADKYCIEELKIFCCRHLATILNVENAVELMVLSDVYNARKLKSMIQNFITKNIVQILKTSGFEEAKKSHPDVVEYRINKNRTYENIYRTK